MYAALPAPPPCDVGSWHATHSVMQSCVLPVRNSPYSSVIERVSKPPPRMPSSAALPEVILSTPRWRAVRASLPVVHAPTVASLRASPRILSVLASLRPLRSQSFLRVAIITACTVW